MLLREVQWADDPEKPVPYKVVSRRCWHCGEWNRLGDMCCMPWPEDGF